MANHVNIDCSVFQVVLGMLDNFLFKSKVLKIFLYNSFVSCAPLSVFYLFMALFLFPFPVCLFSMFFMLFAPMSDQLLLLLS